MDYMQRAMTAIQRIRAHIANLVSGGMVETANAETAQAKAALAVSDREKSQIVEAIERLADEIAPAPAPAPAPGEADAGDGTPDAGDAGESASGKKAPK